jgi:hypothetical protein
VAYTQNEDTILRYHQGIVKLEKFLAENGFAPREWGLFLAVAAGNEVYKLCKGDKDTAMGAAILMLTLNEAAKEGA